MSTIVVNPGDVVVVNDSIAVKKKSLSHTIRTRMENMRRKITREMKKKTI